MSKPIASMMTQQIWSVGIDDTVQEVEKAMVSNRLSMVPVRDENGAVVGVVSSADILRFHAEKKDPTAVRAWQLCTYKPVEVTPDTEISAVAKMMVDRHIHHVLVVENEDIKGIVSSLDFVRTFIADE